MTSWGLGAAEFYARKDSKKVMCRIWGIHACETCDLNLVHEEAFATLTGLIHFLLREEAHIQQLVYWSCRQQTKYKRSHATGPASWCVGLSSSQTTLCLGKWQDLLFELKLSFLGVRLMQMKLWSYTCCFFSLHNSKIEDIWKNKRPRSS